MLTKLTNELLPSPMPWQEFSKLILRDRKTGFDTTDLPSQFIMATGLMEVFDEMMPAVKPSDLEANKWKRWEVYTGQREPDDEVGRALIPDKTGTKILVHNKNEGSSRKVANGLRLYREIHPEEFGDIHIHPGLAANVVEESLPSDFDLVSILSGCRVIELIVTSFCVSVVVRTSETKEIPNLDVAKQYLVAMGRAKNRLTGEGNDSGWQVDIDSLKELKNCFLPRPSRGKYF